MTERTAPPGAPKDEAESRLLSATEADQRRRGEPLRGSGIDRFDHLVAEALGGGRSGESPIHPSAMHPGATHGEVAGEVPAETEEQTESWSLTTDGWLGPRDPALLLGPNREIQSLLAGLGFSPRAERLWPRLWEKLVASIQVEIDDFAAFRIAITGVEERLLAAEAEPGAEDPLVPAILARRDDPLLSALVLARDDSEKVLEILSENPVGTAVAFVEEIPFKKGAQVIWRTPVEVPVLRKQPGDPESFGRLLNEVERLLDPPRTQRQERARNDVLEAIGKLRKLLSRERGYFPAPLQILELKMQEWLHGAHSEKALDGKAAVECLVCEMAEIRHLAAGRKRLEPAAVAHLADAAQEHARLYVETEWMHTPWLTAYVLTNLLASELARFTPIPASRERSPEGILKLVFSEVATGRFDSRESTRRLRKLEEDGLFVHSLVYALLRIGTSAP